MEKEHPKTKVLKNQSILIAEFYSQFTDNLQDYSIFSLIQDFIIWNWIPGLANVFGYETEEVIGESFDTIFTKEDKKEAFPKNAVGFVFKANQRTVF